MYLVLCIDGRERRLKPRDLRGHGGAVVRSTQQVVIVVLHIGNVVLGRSKLLRIVTEGRSFASKEIVVLCGVGLDNFRLAWNSRGYRQQGGSVGTKEGIHSDLQRSLLRRGNGRPL